MSNIKEMSCGFLFRRETKDKIGVYLIKKVKPEWQSGMFNGIGGKFEENEVPYTCFVREVKEECGVDLYPAQVQYLAKYTAKNGYIIHFEIAWLDENQMPMTCEQEEVHYFDVKSLPGNCIKNLYWLIPMALYGNWEDSIEIQEV